MTTIPTRTKQDIRTFVGEQNFLKGQQYMHDGAIVDLVQQGMQARKDLPESAFRQVAVEVLAGQGDADGARACFGVEYLEEGHGVVAEVRLARPRLRRARLRSR